MIYNVITNYSGRERKVVSLRKTNNENVSKEESKITNDVHNLNIPI
ncbi:hypothetical protein [Clostridium cavendishii]|nr:hypothetical protein [Clostridium cavendishii]